MEVAFEIIGWSGMTAVVLAYMAVSMGWMRPDRTFQTINLVGSCAFIVNGVYHGAWPSVAANVAWLLIAIAALLRAGLSPGRQACLPGVGAPSDGGESGEARVRGVQKDGPAAE